MIELNETTWAGRIYAFAIGIWDAFTMGDNDARHTNLCTYIRTVFIWLPLVIVTHVAFVLWVGYVLVYFPITTFGYGYGTFWLWIAGIVAAFGLIYLLLKQSRHATAAISSAGKAVSNTTAWKETETFFGLIWRRVRDAHDRVCTPITFREDAS